MKHKISTLESYENYLKTGATKATGEPATDQYSFDESTGIMKVNLSGNYAFEIRIPITGLKIGDKIKAYCDVKYISGISVQLSSDFDVDSNHDQEGTHRIIKVPNKEISDFQTITLEFVYEGYNNDLVVTNDNTKQTFVRLYFPKGYGGGQFHFKNLTLESDKAPDGITLGTRIYYGMIQYKPTEGFSVVRNRGSNNYDDFNLMVTGSFLSINFKHHFSTRPFIFLEMTNQISDGSNKGVYDVRLSTTHSDQILIYIYDIVNNTILDYPKSVNIPMYFNFFIIGE